MGVYLEGALQGSPPPRKAQLQYILQQLNQPLSQQQEGEEPDDSGDEIQEDDEDDEVTKIFGRVLCEFCTNNKSVKLFSIVHNNYLK